MAEQIRWPRDFAEATDLPADQVGAIVEALIAELDRRSGDIEAEPGTWAEDVLSRFRKGDAIEDLSVEDGPKGFDPETDFCQAGDDGCGPFWHAGHLHWGSEWEDQGQ